MDLRFVETYDRWKEGGIFDVPDHLCPALVGRFAEVAPVTLADVKRQHDYRCLRMMAESLGVTTTDSVGHLLKKTKLKKALIAHFSEDEVAADEGTL